MIQNGTEGTGKYSNQPIRVGAVSYLNTKPLVYGLEKGLMASNVALTTDYPGKIASALLNDEIDIGLVPVAILPQLKEHHIVSDYCIAADGEVASVCLFSEVPVEEITTVLLDYQSRTSVLLVKFLFEQYWKRKPIFVDAGADFINQIGGTTAAVIIGDRAFQQRHVSPFIYDLAACWKLHTGLPFVFAAWISNKPVSADFIGDFNRANQYGLDRIDEVIAQHPFDAYDLKKYYTENIAYRLDAAKMKALSMFVGWCRQVLSLQQRV